MLKKLKSMGKKTKKPLYYKKSKAAKEDEEYKKIYDTEELPQPKKQKQSPSRRKKSSRYNREYEYTDYDDEYGRGNKKSKAAKEDEEYNEIYDTEELPQPKQQKQSPSRRKKSSRYNREYEYTDYDDEYGRGNQYDYEYEKQMYDSEDEMMEYTTEDTSKYRGPPRRTRDNYNPSRTETEYFDDSDSDCRTCTSRTRQRPDYSSDYPSEYQAEEILAPRRRNVRRQSPPRKRRIEPSETELERRRIEPSEMELDRSPYRPRTKNRTGNRRYYHHEYEEEFDGRDPYRDYYESNYRENPYRRTSHQVYVARGPVGHKAFTIKQQQELREQTSASGTEMDENDYEEEQEEEVEEPGWRTNQSRYQVFAANAGENQGIFQKQSSQNPKERLLSVTEYDNSVPMVAFKNTSATKSPDESQLVYLPVVVMDNNIKLPHSKVVRAESILRTIGDKAEKPLETNMHIYLATENEQGNIFQQAQRNNTVEDIKTPKDIQVYTTLSTHSIPVNKKPSVVSKIASMVKIKNKKKSEYPVQKSYINVVPSNTNRVEKKGSKFSIKSRGSKTSASTTSLVGQDKPNSPKGSSYFANTQTKGRKDKKNKRKPKSEDEESAILSVINPTPTGNPSIEERNNTIISTQGDIPKQQSEQRSASQISKKKPTIESRSAHSKKLTKQSTFDRNVPLLKPLSLDKGGVRESTVKNAPSKQSLLERQCSTERKKDSKIITIKDFTNGQFEESKNNFDQSELELQSQAIDSETSSTKKKGFGSYFHKKDNKGKSDKSQEFTPQHMQSKLDPYTFNRDQYTSPTSSIAPVRRQKSKEDTSKPKKSASSKKIKKKRSYVEFSNKNEEYQFWKVLSFDSYAFTYVFQVIQYFLGLSIHGTLMEILRNSKQND